MRRLACRAVVLIGAAACAGPDPATPSDEEAHDLALSIASTLRPQGGGGELGAMVDVAVIARGGTPVGFSPDAHGDLAGEHHGLAYRYAIACRDAHNRPLPACDGRTDNADVHVTWAGVLDLPTLAMVIEREGAWILNDVTPERLRLDGEGTMAYASRIHQPDGTVAVYELAYAASHRAIVLARDARWPRSGTIAYDLTATRTRADAAGPHVRTFDARAELRFAAGGSATIALDGTRTFRLDLATGELARVE